MSKTRKEIILKKRVKTTRYKKGYFNKEIIVTQNSKPLDKLGLISQYQTIYINNIEYEKVVINFKKTIRWICKGWTPNLESFEYINPIFFSGFFNKRNNKKKKKDLITNFIKFLKKKN